jgi:transcriptional regulator with XRE-family HTH domain
MNINPGQVARRISELRQQLQLTQKQFAEKLQVTQPAVSKYMQGRIPPCTVLLSLAQLSGTTMEWLLTGEHISAGLNKVAENHAPYGRSAALAEKIERLPFSLRQQFHRLIDALLQEFKVS